jgi:ribosomal protein S18 acetylase RimI-like enzyme
MFSAQYAYIRGRQLEGTFPGDRRTGIWVVTVMRIGHGWGFVPEQFWPYDTSIWPPAEPAGLDSIARKYRLNTYYRRVRTVPECKAVLLEMPVIAAVTIDENWYNAVQGRIPQLQMPYVSTGSHSVLLVGYDDQKREFIFQNSWGVNWGDKGFGYLPYEVFRETCIEAWAHRLGENANWSQPKLRSSHRSWGIRELTGEIIHGQEIMAGEDRIAWAYAVEDEGALEIEELFVMPQFRRRGHGRALVGAIGSLAEQRAVPLKFWISHADAAPKNLAVVEKLLHPLGLRSERSAERWASYVYFASS